MPIPLLKGVITSYADKDFVIATKSNDNAPVAFRMMFRCRQSKAVTVGKIKFSRAAIRSHDVVAKLNAAFDELPHIPWAVDATTHVAVVARQLHHALAECALFSKRAPPPEWISALAWSHRERIVDNRNCRRRAMTLLRKIYCGFVFRAWRTNFYKRHTLDGIARDFLLDIPIVHDTWITSCSLNGITLVC